MIVAVVAACAAVAAGGGSAAAGGRPVLLVPVGAVDRGVVDQVAAALRARLGVRVRIGRRLAIAGDLRNPERKQVAAAGLISLLHASFAEARGGGAAVLGVTDSDLLPTHAGWQWEFAERDSSVGVVSVARMDQQTWGGEPDRGLLLRRLDKYAVRYGAILALGKHETADPRSALYDSVVALDDLDFMELALAPAPYSVARRGWLDGFERSCRVAGSEWKTVFAGLKTADRDQVSVLFARWANADAGLAADLAARPAGAPAGRSALVIALRQRMAHLRVLAVPARTITQADIKRLVSLDAVLRSTMLEAGSRVCAGEAAG
jgi:predicted Zn-dependent protease